MVGINQKPFTLQGDAKVMTTVPNPQVNPDVYMFSHDSSGIWVLLSPSFLQKE